MNSPPLVEALMRLTLHTSRHAPVLWLNVVTVRGGQEREWGGHSAQSNLSLDRAANATGSALWLAKSDVAQEILSKVERHARLLRRRVHHHYRQNKTVNSWSRCLCNTRGAMCYSLQVQFQLVGLFSGTWAEICWCWPTLNVGLFVLLFLFDIRVAQSFKMRF